MSDWSSDVCSSDLVATREQLVGLGVVERDGGDVEQGMRGMRGMKGAVGNGCGALAIPPIPLSRLPPNDRLHRPINDGQRPQPEEVELHQAYRPAVVLVERRDRAAAVPLPVMLCEPRAEV